MCEPVGWIKIHRKMLKWEWYDDINVKTLFIHCLLKANYEDKNWRGSIVKRGAFITSLEHLSIETKMTKRQVITALDKLITTNEIKKEATNKYTMLTVLNYNTYQDLNDTECNTNVNQTENKCKSNVIPTITTKEYKEIEEYKEEDILSGKPDHDTIYSEIIDYLNLKTGQKYKSNTPKTRQLIHARMKEKFTVEDFKKVIDTKTKEWVNDPRMSPYLRPLTLFSTKFESYLNQKENHGNYDKPKSTNSRNTSISIEELDREVQENWDTIFAEATKYCGNTKSTDTG